MHSRFAAYAPPPLRRTLLFAGLLASAGLVLSASPVRAEQGEIRAPMERVEPWRYPASWQRLHRGMTRFEVMRILGDPGKVSVYDGFERWEYPDLLGGRVNFDDAGLLPGWRAPRPARVSR